MAALFALGAMSLLWMVAIAAVVAVEKLSPWPRASTVAVALGEAQCFELVDHGDHRAGVDRGALGEALLLQTFDRAKRPEGSG